MVALVRSSTLVGIDAVPVDVECVVSSGQLPSYSVVGLPAPTVKEGAVRIRSALKAVGHDLPYKRVVVNLAPADLRKLGSALDLPIAVSILVGDELYDGAALNGLLIVGELGLDGRVRGVSGVLASAMLARSRGMRGIVVPEACANEALVVQGIEVYAVHRLSQVIAALAGTTPLPPAQPHPAAHRSTKFAVDMAEVRGQHQARYAIEVAVAGGHNVMLTGPPGTGKTMLARRLATVLPTMTRDEALEVTKIYSALGLWTGGLVEDRPFRGPHHTISTPALLGGGNPLRPGEISLAHNGVLFLDELPEFSRTAIDGLREPLEDRMVAIHRVSGSLRLPASFLLVAAANPCPCGWLSSGVRECTCSRHAIDRYRGRMSGPLLDRIDLQVSVQPVKLVDLRSANAAESSAQIRNRVIAARNRQSARLAQWGMRCNAEMTSAVLRTVCRLDPESERLLTDLVEHRRTLTARSIDRIIKVARTIADLDGRSDIESGDLEVASAFRPVDPVADADPGGVPEPRLHSAARPSFPRPLPHALKPA